MSTDAHLSWLWAIPLTIASIWVTGASAVTVLVAIDCVRERRPPGGFDLLFIALGPVSLVGEAYVRIFDRDDDEESGG